MLAATSLFRTQKLCTHRAIPFRLAWRGCNCRNTSIPSGYSSTSHTWPRTQPNSCKLLSARRSEPLPYLLTPGRRPCTGLSIYLYRRSPYSGLRRSLVQIEVHRGNDRYISSPLLKGDLNSSALLRLLRDAWSIVKQLRYIAHEYTLPPPKNGRPHRCRHVRCLGPLAMLPTLFGPVVWHSARPPETLFLTHVPPSRSWWWFREPSVLPIAPPPFLHPGMSFRFAAPCAP